MMDFGFKSNIRSFTSFILAGPNGSKMKWQSISELVTIAAAATTTTATNLLPANSRILGVAYRVTTVIPTAATFSIGIAADTTLFGTGISTAANTTNTSFAIAAPVNDFMNTTAATLLITPNSTPAANTGRLRVTVFYVTLTAHAS